MDTGRWERDEFLITLDLYLNEEGFIEDQNDPRIKQVASLINRTPGSVALRLANYRHLDPQSSKGMENTGEKCRQIWEEFYENEAELAEEAGRARDRLESGKEVSEDKEIETGTRKAEIKTREGQNDFRKVLRERYKDKCIVCDISEPGLLQASHILDWSNFEEKRGNPENGLLLCYTHHRAFDLGFFTITKSCQIKVRPDFEPESELLQKTLIEKDGEKLDLENPPSSEILEQHNEQVYWWSGEENL